MKLFIDTSSNQKTIVKLGNQELARNSRVWRSQVVLPLIDRLLKEQRKTVMDIKEIKVVTKGTSFTGLRVGMAIANALSYALKLTNPLP